MPERFTDPSFFRKHPFNEYLFIFSTCMGQLLTQAANATSLTHFNQLKSDFNAPESMKPWYMASFGLSVGTIILISGRIGDVYGIRLALVIGYVITCLFSILSGISYYDRHDGSAMYICCRAFQGVGIAFILPNILGAAGRVYSPGTLRKKMVFGCIGLSAPIGGWVGSFMSGVIAQTTHRWDWNYYAFAIITLICGVVTFLSTPPLEPKLLPDGSRPDVDWIGGFFAVSSLTLFNFSWNQAPVVGWQSPYIIVLLIVGVLLFGVFAVWELRFATNPLLPESVLKNRKLATTLLVLFLGWGAFGINLYHTFTLLQDFRHYSPLAAGAGITPAPPMGFIAAISCSVLINPRTVDALLFGSMCAFTAASIILATAEVNQSYFRNTMGAWIIAPFGMDWSFPAGSILLSEELPQEWQGLAGSLVTVVMNYGVSIFLGVAGTVEEQLLKQRPEDTWRAWRGAEYFSVGISGFACAVSLLFGHKAIWALVTGKRENVDVDMYKEESYSVEQEQEREKRGAIVNEP